MTDPKTIAEGLVDASPADTCPNSRHVANLAVLCRTNPLRRVLIDIGQDPEHAAESLEGTVQALWQARRELREGGR